GRDVGHDAQREHREPRQAAAGERVQQVQEVVLAQRDRVGVDRRRRQVRTEPVDQQHGGGEQQLAPQVRDAPGAEEVFEHYCEASSSAGGVSVASATASPSPACSGSASASASGAALGLRFGLGLGVSTAASASASAAGSATTSSATSATGAGLRRV